MLIKKISIIGLLVAVISCMNACSIYTGQTPLWYDFSGIDMDDYESQKFVLLPVTAEKGEGIDEEGKKELVSSIRSQFKRVFSVKPRYLSPELLAREGFSKPYNFREVAKHFDAQAVLIVSVFDVESSVSRSNKIEYRNVGLKISCFDAEDPYKYWRLSKRYQSDNGFNVKNIDFDYVLYSDLRSIRKVVKSRDGSRNTKLLDEKSAPSILVSVNDTNVSNTSGGGDSFVTRANTFELQLSAIDAYGLSMITIYDQDNNILDEIDFSYMTVKNYSESIPVSLRKGGNKIRIDVSNVEQKEITRYIKITRKVVESTHLIAVSSPYSTGKGISLNENSALSQLNKNISKRYNNLIYLNQGLVSRQEILKTIELLALDAEDDDSLNPVFFFSGRIQRFHHKRYGEKYYLMLADSDDQYLRSTAIDLDEVIDLLGERAFIMLEHCSSDEKTIGNFRLLNRGAPIKVNIYPCENVMGDISSRLLKQYKKNRSLESIIAGEKNGLSEFRAVGQDARYSY